MLKWALIFFLISVVAAVFGFTNVAAGAQSIAKLLFFLFLVLFLDRARLRGDRRTDFVLSTRGITGGRSTPLTLADSYSG